MKAVRFYGFGQEAKLDQVPEPSVGETDVLLRVKACQIGGDILNVFASKSGPGRGASEFVFPHIPGFRSAGIVEKVGPGVTSVARGDRVAVNGLVNCRSCPACLQGRDNLCDHYYMLGIDSGHPGALAEMVKAPQWVVYKLPHSVSFNQATVFPNIALLIHALDRARPKPGFTAALFGVGRVGSTAIQVARAYGCSWMICVDKREDALEMARRLGANETVNSDASNVLEVIRDKTSGRGVDIAIELVGVDETILQTIQSTRRGGTSLLVGMLKPIVLHLDKYNEDIMRKEIDIKSCFSKAQSDFEHAIKLAGAGFIDMTVQDFQEYELSSFKDAFKKAGDPHNKKLCIVKGDSN
jgi:threonine dehydrogenase-like Zn-dependent dehydrogenase